MPSPPTRAEECQIPALAPRLASYSDLCFPNVLIHSQAAGGAAHCSVGNLARTNPASHRADGPRPASAFSLHPAVVTCRPFTLVGAMLVSLLVACTPIPSELATPNIEATVSVEPILPDAGVRQAFNVTRLREQRSRPHPALIRAAASRRRREWRQRPTFVRGQSICPRTCESNCARTCHGNCQSARVSFRRHFRPSLGATRS